MRFPCQFQNEKEITSYLEQKGFTKYKLESLSFFQQIYLFNNAKIIIGAHGAGFTNLTFSNNVHTVITGPNGSGKSTLLGLIAGLYTASSGYVNINTSKIGYVGVTPLVFEGTIKENLLYGNSNQIDDEDLIKLMDEFNFFNNEKYNLDYKVNNKTLSSGQLQKISFMRSLLNDSKLLLLDESTSNIDVKSKAHIKNILNEREISVINCTHNVEDFDYQERYIITVDEDSRIIKKV